MGQKKTSGVDAEIALTAFIATSVTAFPNQDLGIYPLIRITAVSLLFLTLIRHMAVTHGIASNSKLLKSTTYVLDPATYVSIFYLFYVCIEQVLMAVNMAEAHPILFVLTASAAIVSVFITWEVVFRAALEEGERAFSEVADDHQGELIGALFSRLARFSQRERVYGESYLEQTSLDTFRDNTREFEDLTQEEQWNVAKHILSAIVAIVFPVLSFLALIFIGSYLTSGWWVTMAALLGLVLVTSGFVRLWYSRYGVVKLEDRNGYIVFVGDVVAYAALSWMLL